MKVQNNAIAQVNGHKIAYRNTMGELTTAKKGKAESAGEKTAATTKQASNVAKNATLKAYNLGKSMSTKGSGESSQGAMEISSSYSTLKPINRFATNTVKSAAGYTLAAKAIAKSAIYSKGSKKAAEKLKYINLMAEGDKDKLKDFKPKFLKEKDIKKLNQKWNTPLKNGKTRLELIKKQMLLKNQVSALKKAKKSLKYANRRATFGNNDKLSNQINSLYKKIYKRKAKNKVLTEKIANANKRKDSLEQSKNSYIQRIKGERFSLREFVKKNAKKIAAITTISFRKGLLKKGERKEDKLQNKKSRSSKKFERIERFSGADGLTKSQIGRKRKATVRELKRNAKDRKLKQSQKSLNRLAKKGEKASKQKDKGIKKVSKANKKGVRNIKNLVVSSPKTVAKTITGKAGFTGETYEGYNAVKTYGSTAVGAGKKVTTWSLSAAKSGKKTVKKGFNRKWQKLTGKTFRKWAKEERRKLEKKAARVAVQSTKKAAVVTAKMTAKGMSVVTTAAAPTVAKMANYVSNTAVVQGATRVAKPIAKGTVKVAKPIAKGTAKAAKEVKKWDEKATKAIVKAAKRIGTSIAKAAVAVASAVVSFFSMMLTAVAAVLSVPAVAAVLVVILVVIFTTSLIPAFSSSKTYTVTNPDGTTQTVTKQTYDLGWIPSFLSGKDSQNNPTGLTDKWVKSGQNQWNSLSYPEGYKLTYYASSNFTTPMTTVSENYKELIAELYIWSGYDFEKKSEQELKAHLTEMYNKTHLFGSCSGSCSEYLQTGIRYDDEGNIIGAEYSYFTLQVIQMAVIHDEDVIMDGYSKKDKDAFESMVRDTNSLGLWDITGSSDNAIHGFESLNGKVMITTYVRKTDNAQNISSTMSNSIALQKADTSKTTAQKVSSIAYSMEVMNGAATKYYAIEYSSNIKGETSSLYGKCTADGFVYALFTEDMPASVRSTYGNFCTAEQMIKRFKSTNTPTDGDIVVIEQTSSTGKSTYTSGIYRVYSEQDINSSGKYVPVPYVIQLEQSGVIRKKISECSRNGKIYYLHVEAK